MTLSEGSVLANSLVEYMDFSGLDLGGDGARVAYSIVRKNGALGIVSSGKKSIIAERNQVLDNNYRGFVVDWIAGGMKFDTHSPAQCATTRSQATGPWDSVQRLSQRWTDHGMGQIRARQPARRKRHPD